MREYPHILMRTLDVFALLLSIGLSSASTAMAGFLPGTVPLTPGSTVYPGLVAPGTDPGTLLAWMSSPFTYPTSAGANTGFVNSAVYSDGGTLDFYYQVINNPSSSNSLVGESDANFMDFAVQVGFRIDGSSLMVPVFSDGTVPPVIVDSSSDGSVIGFDFAPPTSAEIAPGATSDVFVISTDATNFNKGTASVFDGGTASVAAFEPTAVPESSSVVLLSLGLIGLLGLQRIHKLFV